MRFDDIVELVRRERMRQDTKWGRAYHHPDTWLRIATEEMGEIASLIDDDYLKRCQRRNGIDRLEHRGNSVAVIFAWLESDSWDANRWLAQAYKDLLTGGVWARSNVADRELPEEVGLNRADGWPVAYEQQGSGSANRSGRCSTSATTNLTPA